jgi:hypothetical protein
MPAHDPNGLSEPLSALRARWFVRKILQDGCVMVSGHAQREMAKDNLTMLDVTNVLRGGVVDPAEYENGSWRHGVRTSRIVVVIAFHTATELRVVTAWWLNP